LTGCLAPSRLYCLLGTRQKAEAGDSLLAPALLASFWTETPFVWVSARAPLAHRSMCQDGTVASQGLCQWWPAWLAFVFSLSRRTSRSPPSDTDTTNRFRLVFFLRFRSVHPRAFVPPQGPSCCRRWQCSSSATRDQAVTKVLLLGGLPLFPLPSVAAATSLCRQQTKEGKGDS